MIRLASVHALQKIAQRQRGDPGLQETNFSIGFNTGIVNRPVIQIPPPECPSCRPPGPREANGMREFNVSTLVGVARFPSSTTTPRRHARPPLLSMTVWRSGTHWPAGFLGGIQVSPDQI